jgi:hypothetical protein
VSRHACADIRELSTRLPAFYLHRSLSPSSRPSFRTLLPGFLASCYQPRSTPLRQLGLSICSRCVPLLALCYRTIIAPNHLLPPLFPPLQQTKGSYTGTQVALPACSRATGSSVHRCSASPYLCVLCFSSKLIDSGLIPRSGTNSRNTTPPLSHPRITCYLLRPELPRGTTPALRITKWTTKELVGSRAGAYRLPMRGTAQKMSPSEIQSWKPVL